jgi:hypothetical protein
VNSGSDVCFFLVCVCVFSFAILMERTGYHEIPAEVTKSCATKVGYPHAHRHAVVSSIPSGGAPSPTGVGGPRKGCLCQSFFCFSSYMKQKSALVCAYSCTQKKDRAQYSRVLFVKLQNLGLPPVFWGLNTSL